MVISQADLCKHLSDRILWRLATMQDDEKVPMLPLQYHQIPLAVRQQCNAPIGRGTFRCECKLLLSIASLGLGLTRRKFCRLQVKAALVFCYEKEPCILLFGTYEECAEIGTFLGGAPVQRRPIRKLAQTPNTEHTLHRTGALFWPSPAAALGKRCACRFRAVGRTPEVGHRRP